MILERSVIRARFVVLTALAVTACNGVGPFEANRNDGLAVTPPTVLLGAIGARRQLGLTNGDGEPIDGSGAIWRSSAPGVVAVDGSGTVTAAGDGQATISVDVGARQASATVTVAATIEIEIEVTATDQSDADAADNRVVRAITVRAQ